jgi:RND family efflux transporter MFP subunit
VTANQLLTLADLEHMDVETDVAEKLLSRIAVGQPAEISVIAVPSKRYRGRLRQIIPYSDRASNMVKVKVEVVSPDDCLFPGLEAKVNFLPEKSQQAPDVSKSQLFVPKPALIEEDGKFHVWLVDSKNLLHKTRVEVVLIGNDLAQLESGLKLGDSVVLNPTPALAEGETVKVAD